MPPGRKSIVRRLALLGGTVAALTALVSGAVPLLLLSLRLHASDQQLARQLAASVDAGIERERREQPTLEDAVREALNESTLERSRVEVWGPRSLIAVRGAGSVVGRRSAGTAESLSPYRGRLIMRRTGVSGVVIAVAVPSSFPPALRREMGVALVFAVLPLSLLAGAISVRLARRAVAPLQILATHVARQDPAHAFVPVTSPSPDAELVRLAEAFNETGERLSRALAAEREFASYAAHALRTPLTRLAASAHGGAPISEGALLTLQRLVDSLLVFVRSDVRLDLTGATINVADLVRRVALEHAGGDRPIVVDAPDEMPVRGDEELLTAAIGHLVENAVAYSTPGARVALSVAQADGQVTIAVHDEGPGIPAAEAERIFEPFVRGAAAGVVEGSGLGLALVRRIALGHGGRAHVAPVAAGCRVEVVLPAWTARR
ncbi:MAG: HAMP domain-containing sensor histidine kinase [Thermoanaerobaculia bacterium]